MVRLRQAKVDAIADTIPDIEVDDPGGDARILMLGWGSTYGPIGAACQIVRRSRSKSPRPTCDTSTPFPANLGEVLASDGSSCRR